MHTILMNKFDPDGHAILMAIIEAESRHPEPGDGAMQRFSIWQQPRVVVNGLEARAVAYTRRFGLLSWQEADGTRRTEWFPAELIKRLPG